MATTAGRRSDSAQRDDGDVEPTATREIGRARLMHPLLPVARSAASIIIFMTRGHPPTRMIGTSSGFRETTRTTGSVFANREPDSPSRRVALYDRLARVRASPQAAKHRERTI